MNRNIFPALTAVVFFLAACTDNGSETTTETTEAMETSADNRPPAYQSFNQMPTFNMQTTSGSTVQLGDLKGKKVFVNLWASWCPPCRREMPSIEKLAQSVDTSKVAFVLLSLDDEFGKAKDFVTAQNLNLPIYYPAENLPELFNVQAIPSTFIFDEKGSLLKRIDGGEDYDTDAYRHLLQ